MSLSSHFFFWLAAFVMLCGASAETARADDAVSTSASGGASYGDVDGPSPDRGLPVAGWILYPSFLAGVVFNDNVYATSTRRQSALGLRFRPKLEATLDNGLHKTDLSFSAEAQSYPGADRTVRSAYGYMFQPSYLTGRASITHQWKPLSDVTVEGVGFLARASGLSGASLAQGAGLDGLIGAGVSSAITPNPYTLSGAQQYYNQIGGWISLEKKLENLWSIRASAGAQSIFYDNLPGQNGTSYYATLRGGYQVTPLLRAFVEAGPNRRVYSNALSNSIGYHVVGGLESDMIGLFRGEVYGGYQSLTRKAGGSNISRPTFGGRIHYYPLPYLEMSAGFQQSIGWGAPTTIYGQPFGVARSNRTWTALAEARYTLSAYWWAYLRGGYSETQWSNGNGTDGRTKNLLANIGVSYNFWRNISLTLDYQFAKAAGCPAAASFACTNVAGLLNPFVYAQADYASGFVQNQIVVGLTYHY